MIRMRPGQKIVMLDGSVQRLYRVAWLYQAPLIYRIDYWPKTGRRSCLAEYRNGWWKEVDKKKVHEKDRRNVTLTEP